jgi:hypothetical protein
VEDEAEVFTGDPVGLSVKFRLSPYHESRPKSFFLLIPAAFRSRRHRHETDSLAASSTLCKAATWPALGCLEASERRSAWSHIAIPTQRRPEERIRSWSYSFHQTIGPINSTGLHGGATYHSIWTGRQTEVCISLGRKKVCSQKLSKRLQFYIHAAHNTTSHAWSKLTEPAE